jgi:glycolate oxidase iron-sulfur subunit
MPDSLLAAEFSSPEFQALLDRCIHCGMCLQACPTYTVFGTESDSPRGRIALIRAAAEGRIGLEETFRKHIDLCLTCRSCESACPSGVHYEALVDTARLALDHSRQPGLGERFIRWFGLRQLMPRVDRLKSVAALMRIYQDVGLSRLVRALNFLPTRLKTMEGMLPRMPRKYADYRRPAPARGVKRGTVAFFYGCMQEAFLADVNAATVRVLQENGFEVRFPVGQTCCGAAQLHTSEKEEGLLLARRNIDACLEPLAGGEHFTAIINNAGGCGAVLKEYADLLKDDAQYAQKAAQFTGLVRDISEFLVEQGYKHPSGVIRARATYSDSCHLRHVQKVVRQPREILQSIPGLDLVELSAPDLCCGSAGVYNIVHTPSANAILDHKMLDIAATGADLIVAANTGCYFQLTYGVQRAHSKARVVHVVELLDQSYRAGEGSTAAASQPGGSHAQ